MDLSRQKLLDPSMLDSNIAIVGLGALGSVVLELLVRAGIKHFKIADPDLVEESNLQRQVIYTNKQINMPKVYAARDYALEINPKVNIECLKDRINAKNIHFIDSEIIVDCTDNLNTRFLINDYAVKHKIPWIFGSAIRQEGMVFLTNDKPCFQCIFKNSGLDESCEREGILNSVSSLIGSLQAHYVFALLREDNIKKELIKVDLKTFKIENFKVKNNNCNACKGNFNYLNKPFVVEKCKVKKHLRITPINKSKLNIANLKKLAKITAENKYSIAGEINKVRFITEDIGLKVATTNYKIAEKIGEKLFS